MNDLFQGQALLSLRTMAGLRWPVMAICRWALGPLALLPEELLQRGGMLLLKLVEIECELLGLRTILRVQLGQRFSQLSLEPSALLQLHLDQCPQHLDVLDLVDGHARWASKSRITRTRLPSRGASFSSLPCAIRAD